MKRIGSVCLAAVTATIALAAFSLVGFGQAEDEPVDGDLAEMPVIVVSQTPPPPKTKLETLLRRKETVIHRASKEVAVVPGEDGSSIRITAVELTDGFRQERAYGLTLGVETARGPGAVHRSCVSHIDLDELDLLINGMDAVTRAARSGTVLTDFAASYRSRGEFDVTNFETNGGRMIAVRSVQTLLPSGQVQWATAYLQLGMLGELRRQVVAGKSMLDEVRGAN
jgi:hypothetical protein